MSISRTRWKSVFERATFTGLHCIWLHRRREILRERIGKGSVSEVKLFYPYARREGKVRDRMQRSLKTRLLVFTSRSPRWYCYFHGARWYRDSGTVFPRFREISRRSVRVCFTIEIGISRDTFAKITEHQAEFA